MRLCGNECVHAMTRNYVTKKMWNVSADRVEKINEKLEVPKA